MNNNKNKQILFGIIGILILVIAVVGVTFAFFNYTRTGNNNTVQAGRIYFNSTEGNTINLENAFPISSTDAQTDTTNAKTLQITVTGDTSYSRGLEYLVTATDVHMTTTTGKTVPVTIEVSVTGNNSKTLGTSDDEYYTNRGGNTSIYKIEYDGDLNENDHILVGYISPDTTETGVDGLINIKAYFNEADILISDTYNNGNPPTDELGTPASLGEGKTVFTTTEWNSLKESNALSFKVKVEAQEGVWVSDGTTPAECFTTTVENNEVTITRYDVNCGGTDVVIPNTIGGNPVKSIGGGAFAYMQLTSIVIPNSVTTIGGGAFQSNQLTSIVIPNSVTTIGGGAFSANQLTSIVIPNSVTTIGGGAFSANQLTYIEINAPQLNLGSGIFGGNTLDKTVKVNCLTIAAEAFKGSNIIELELGDSVTTIGNQAFANNKISSIIIPENVTTLGSAPNGAFANNQLTYIEINAPQLNLGSAVFINNKLDKIVKVNCLTIGDNAFPDDYITELEIGDSVTTIGIGAFVNGKLTSVTIGNGITSIGNYAFQKSEYSNTNLSSITINKSCNDIKNNLLSGNTNYYPWLNNNSPYTASGVTIYGANNEICDTF